MSVPRGRNVGCVCALTYFSHPRANCFAFVDWLFVLERRAENASHVCIDFERPEATIKNL